MFAFLCHLVGHINTSVAEYAARHVQLNIWTEIYTFKSSSFELYEDDGLSLQYQTGKFALTRITTTVQPKNLKVYISKSSGHYEPELRTYVAKIRLGEGQKPSAITENGKKIALGSKSTLSRTTGYFFDEKENVVYVKTARNNKSNIELIVKY